MRQERPCRPMWRRSTALMAPAGRPHLHTLAALMAATHTEGPRNGLARRAGPRPDHRSGRPDDVSRTRRRRHVAHLGSRISASAVRPGTARRARPRPRPLRALADPHVSRRVAGHGADRTGGLPADRWRALPRLHRTDPPTLQPGAVADNPSIQRAIQAAGAIWWPPDSPDLNPIELREEPQHRDAPAVPRRVLGEPRMPQLFRHCGYSAATRS